VFLKHNAWNVPEYWQRDYIEVPLFLPASSQMQGLDVDEKKNYLLLVIDHY
jgi:hypothetical protein